MSSIVIGLVTTNLFFLKGNFYNHFSYKVNNESIRVSGINLNLSEAISGKVGEFDNVFIKISSTNEIKLLDVSINEATIHAASHDESNANLYLIGLTFPLINHQRATIINLKNLINKKIQEEGKHTVTLTLRNKSNENKETEIYQKEIVINAY